MEDQRAVMEILVPPSLLTSEAIAEAWRQQHQRSESSYRTVKYPADKIHVSKKRQKSEVSLKLPEDLVACHIGTPRTNHQLSALEEGKGGISPVMGAAEIHFQKKGASRSTPLLGPRFAPNKFASETPLPIGAAGHGSKNRPRNSSHGSEYNMASLVNIKYRRKYWRRKVIEYGAYTFLASIIYFLLIGIPLWNGALYWLHWLMHTRFLSDGGWAIVVVMLILCSYAPLITRFEEDAPGPEYYRHCHIERATTALETALIIPCYRSAPIIGRTLEAALKIFPASHIYVIANGNSSVPLDNTDSICRTYGVNHIWCPVGSKIVALFVGCYAVKKRFRYVLLMDDDCILPDNFPIVSSRLTDSVRCIGYTIKSVGIDSSMGSYCQQAQDLEYKLAGLQRSFAGRIGSATFPHGAISLWEKSFLKKTLEHHPGFSISEDWFIGNSCRSLGGRIQMCSAVFVETTTPSALLFTNFKKKERGGFGETTVLQQRFSRWNFFVAHGLSYNLAYLFSSWRLGKWEIGTKMFVVQETYETILYILAPFVLPISLLIRPWFCVAIMIAMLGLYLLHIILFNEIHLRRKNEHVNWKVLAYFMPYKVLLSVINVASCYYSLVKYARYFAKTRPKLTEDHKAVGIVLKLEEMTDRCHESGR